MSRSTRGLDVLNFALADVQTGVGPFLAVFLAAHRWDEQQVGLALTVGGIAGIAMQTPVGALVDRLREKRMLIATAVAIVALGAGTIALAPRFWPVLVAQVLIGAASSVFIPAICALSLGLVGRDAFDARQGRNQGLNAAGNVAAAIAMGLLGYFVSGRSAFLLAVALALPTVLALRLIDPAEIDHAVARGADGPPAHGRIFDRRLVIFLISAVLFHFANAAMLPLLGELLAKGRGDASMLTMSACIVTTQLAVVALSGWAGRKARSWGRKPVLLIAFVALPIRGLLYTLTSNTALLIAIQLLDGIAAAIFGVVSVLVIADLTRGTGRFNLTLGAVTMAVGIGAAMSQLVAGTLVVHAGSSVGFLVLAGIAAVGCALFALAMPETR